MSILKKIRGASTMLVHEPKMFLFFLHRHVARPSMREPVADVAAFALECARGRWPSKNGGFDGTAAERAALLRKKGIVHIEDQLTKTEIGEVRDWLKTEVGNDPYQEHLGKFTHENPPMDARLLYYPDETILRCPYLLDIANRRENLALAEHFLGARPTISILGLWWSFPGHDRAKEAQFFHRDIDDLRFVKLFLYLSDVDDEAGPHVFVPGSHRMAKCLEARRHTDDEIRQAFGPDSLLHICGEQGTSFMEYTFGFHKGLLPRSRPRLMYQVTYSLFPQLNYQYGQRLPMPPGALYDPYVNRLYFDRASANGNGAFVS